MNAPATALVTGARRRDPAVIAARAHHVLDAAARSHARWPASGHEAIGRALISLHVALEKFALAGEDGRELAAEDAAIAMALLLLSVSVFLGKDEADGMMRDAAEVAR